MSATPELPHANGTQRPPISLVHSQTAAEIRQRMHHALEGMAERLRDKDRRHREAMRTAYTQGMQLGRRQAQDSHFFLGLLLGCLVGAGVTVALSYIIQHGLQA